MREYTYLISHCENTLQSSLVGQKTMITDIQKHSRHHITVFVNHDDNMRAFTLLILDFLYNKNLNSLHTRRLVGAAMKIPDYYSS